MTSLATNDNQKSFDYLPWSVAFAPDGLALAIGLRDFGALLYCRS
jgi:hypothetical protein